jgi:hypothetical protein
LPETPISLGKSIAQKKSYSLFRYLYSNNVYAIVHAPLHDGILFYSLQARSQGLLCFPKTLFLSDIDSLPLTVVKRISHGDPDGNRFGEEYLIDENIAIEGLKEEYMAQKAFEMSDFVMSGDISLINTIKSVLKWNFDSDKFKRSSFGVSGRRIKTQTSDDSVVELVFVGNPFLSVASGIKMFSDALDSLHFKTQLKVTFLGHNVQLNNPQLSAKDFIDLRSYSWNNVDLKFVDVDGNFLLFIV